MSLAPNQAKVVRKLVALATELRSVQVALLDRRNELLEKQRDRQRRLQHMQRQNEAQGRSVGYPLGGGRDEALTPLERGAADAQAALDQVNADIRAMEDSLASLARDKGEAAKLADRVLQHEGLDEDLQRVARIG